MTDAQLIGAILKERNIVLKGGDIISTGGGFTQVPNFILVSQKISVGAKLTYAMLLKYAWQNDYCFPRVQIRTCPRKALSSSGF